MIALNTKQGLVANAFWYLALRSLALAAILILIGTLLHATTHSTGTICHGAACGNSSGGVQTAILYFLAIVAVLRTVVYFRSFSFVLTDANLTVDSGIIWQTSCTIRFDRIQDVDVIRGPLHRMLGLKSVAVWTASLDQRVGKTPRPDALLVLEDEAADWLRDFLTNPAAGKSQVAAGPSDAAPPTSRFGPVLVMLVVISAVVALWELTPVPKPATDSATFARQSSAGVPSANAHSVNRSLTKPHRVHTITNDKQVATAYSVACAIHGSNSASGLKPCAELGEARRCEHEADFSSQPTPEPALLTVMNRSDQNVMFYWLDRSGFRSLYASLPPGGHVQQPSHIGANWLVSTQDGECIGIFNAATMTVGVF
jgi:membrane protein YdbS with pleckstrin-like domain